MRVIKKVLLFVSCLIFSASLFLIPADDALAKKGRNGPHKTPGPPFHPPGWDKGEKKGWGDGDVPPGLSGKWEEPSEESPSSEEIKKGGKGKGKREKGEEVEEVEGGSAGEKEGEVVEGKGEKEGKQGKKSKDGSAEGSETGRKAMKGEKGREGKKEKRGVGGAIRKFFKGGKD